MGNEDLIAGVLLFLGFCMLAWVVLLGRKYNHTHQSTRIVGKWTHGFTEVCSCGMRRSWDRYLGYGPWA